MRKQENTIIEVQKTLLDKALSSHQPTTWKIIIFDAYNRNILSSQFKMKDLRHHNITLYMSIKQQREQLHGVTILYFIQPTLENVQLISRDLFEDLYSSIVIHFSSEPTPNILSTLAKNIGGKKPTLLSRIARIEYSCLGFYTIDNNLVILPSQVQITNFLMAMKLKPIFIYHTGDQQCRKLAQKTKMRFEEKQETQKFQYGIFYLYNRENDYFPVLSHGITYASLVENIHSFNNIGSKITKNNKQTWDLSLTDEIWLNKKNMLISDMHLEKDFNAIKAKMLNLSQEQYTEANEKSKKIQWHINNAEEMIKEAKKRRLNQFNQLQLELYSKKSLGKEQFRDLLSILEDKNVQSEDKIRILVLYLNFCEHLDELETLEKAFPDAKKNNKYNEIKLKRMKDGSGGQNTSKYIKKLAKGLWTNLVSTEKKFPLTKDIEKIKKCEFAELKEAGLVVDGVGQIPQNVRIGQTIAYCLGGVCFHEYSNINEYNPDIIYSGSEIVNATDLIK